MTADRRVPTRAIQTAVKARETEILDGLKIDWRSGQPHITCPYPSHDDEDPSWRWDEKKARAVCSCLGEHSIFDVVAAKESIDFEEAKIRVAQMLGLEELTKEGASGKGEGHQATDAESLLNPASDNRDDTLPRAYLAHRLAESTDFARSRSTATILQVRCARRLERISPIIPRSSSVSVVFRGLTTKLDAAITAP